MNYVFIEKATSRLVEGGIQPNIILTLACQKMKQGHFILPLDKTELMF